MRLRRWRRGCWRVRREISRKIHFFVVCRVVIGISLGGSCKIPLGLRTNGVSTGHSPRKLAQALSPAFPISFVDLHCIRLPG